MSILALFHTCAEALLTMRVAVLLSGCAQVSPLCVRFGVVFTHGLRPLVEMRVAVFLRGFASVYTRIVCFAFLHACAQATPRNGGCKVSYWFC